MCVFPNHSFVVFEKFWMIRIGNILGVQSYDQFCVHIISHGVRYRYMPAVTSFLLLFSSIDVLF